MNKHYYLFITVFSLLLQLPSQAQLTGPTKPVSSVSFPKEVFDMDSGKIEFFAKLRGFTGVVSDGEDLFVIADGQNWDGTGCTPSFNGTWNGTYVGFSGNNGVGAGGLIIQAGTGFDGGSTTYGNITYENIYGGTEEVKKWHCYRFEWNRNGLPTLNRKYKCALYLDNKLNTTFWQNSNTCALFTPFIDGTFDLIASYYWPPSDKNREVWMDELRIYNGAGKLVLYNTLDSKEAVENSAKGLNGSFNGYGDAHFVKGVKGNALAAKFVRSQPNTIAAKPLQADVKVTAGSNLKVYPNPVQGNILRLQYNAATAGKVQFIITDISGHIFNKQEILLIKGNNSIQYNINHLAQGVYFLKTVVNAEQQQVRFMKTN